MKTFVKASVEENLLPRKLRRKEFTSSKVSVKVSVKISVNTFVEANLLQFESIGGNTFKYVKASVKSFRGSKFSSPSRKLA